jgi:4-hydroxy-tetrahydrodipicolinate synthase
MLNLAGIYPALTTPFAADGSVSLEGMKHNIGRYNQTVLAGYVVLGSTGESVLLRSNEKDGILDAVKQTAAPGKKLIAGTGAESTAETIERTQRAAALGYDVALVKTPYYYKPAYKAEVLIAHYRRVADESPIPVLLYSVPIFTGLPLEAPETIALAEHQNIIGIKDSSGNVQRISEMIAGAPAHFQVLVGAAATVFPCLAVGARGAILALASALPEKCATLYELFRQGQMEQARELQKVLLRASNQIVSKFGIAGVKFVMGQRGYRGGNPRLPLQPLTDEHKSRISSVLASIEQPIMASA